MMQMGIHVGLPKFVSSAAHEVKSAAKGVATTLEHPVRAAKHAAGAAAHDAFVVANKAVMHLTSAPGKQLVKHELELAKQAQDPKRSSADREASRAQMRRMMGAEPSDKLDPLPAAASPAAEKARAHTAKVWDPTAEPANTKAQWATNDSGGAKKSDPVNLYVHGNLGDIVRGFQKAGWSIASPGDAAGNAGYASALKGYLKQDAEAALIPGKHISAEAYHQVNKMPVGDLYLNGKKPLVSMEANNHPLSGRDHFRIFETGKKDAQGNNIYAVTASRDEGIKLDPKRQKTAYTNHFTEKNADPERDFTLQTLLASGTQVEVRSTRRDLTGGPAGGLGSADRKVYDLTIAHSKG